MRPAPIPAEEVWDGAQRLVIGPPDNDLDSGIAAVEVVADTVQVGDATGPRLSVRCVLEDNDLETLTAGGTVWVSFYGGQLLPFSVEAVPAAGAGRSYVRVDADLSGPAPDFRACVSGVPDGMTPADFAEGCAEALVEMAREWRAKG